MLLIECLLDFLTNEDALKNNLRNYYYCMLFTKFLVNYLANNDALNDILLSLTVLIPDAVDEISLLPFYALLLLYLSLWWYRNYYTANLVLCCHENASDENSESRRSSTGHLFLIDLNDKLGLVPIYLFWNSFHEYIAVQQRLVNGVMYTGVLIEMGIGSWDDYFIANWSTFNVSFINWTVISAIYAIRSDNRPVVALGPSFQQGVTSPYYNITLYGRFDLTYF